MSLRVAIGRGCTGMGSCTRLAPQVFRIDPATGKAEVLLDDCTAHRAGVLAAAQACPFVQVEIDGVPVSEPIENAPVVAAERLTPDILALRLRRPGFSFIPGQYVFLRLEDPQGEFFRTYSVVAVDGDTVTLCIRLVPNGRAGQILSAISPGRVLGLSRAKGLFALETPDRPKLFVTGGTGLAPVIPMCRAAPHAHKLVVIGARNPKELFWGDLLRAIPNTEVIEVVQAADTGWNGPVGLVTAPLETIDPADWAEVYTCGSPGMVEAVRRTLVGRGMPAERVRSDSFLAAGTPAGSGSRPAVAAASPGHDWPGLIRRVHYIASAPLALIILFYAVTGFIANRSSLFVGESTTVAAHVVPAGVALEQAALAPVLAAMLPPGAELRAFTPGPDPCCLFADGGGRAWRLSVDATSRAVRIEERGELPPAIPLTPAAIAAALTGRLSGEADLERASADDESVELAFASVWGSHQVHVDTATRTWTAIATRPPLVVSLTDLHRGKHAGAWQRIVIDLTALVLASLTLSGAAMSLTVAVRRRRLQAAALLAVSALLLALLILAR
jgi:ferredoxin-NADP reductase/ferredoxin